MPTIDLTPEQLHAHITGQQVQRSMSMYASSADYWKNQFLAAEKDAVRYRWLAARMLAADFDYGGDGTQALVFEMPPGFSASADCNATVDAAMAAAPAVGAA